MGISIRDLSMSYSGGDRPIDVLRNVNLEIEDGDFIAITGPSGSGKSTLLLLLGGMLLPTAGDVYVDGIALYQLSAQKRTVVRREKIAYVFQTFHLIPYLTALQNVQVALMVQKLPRQEHRARAMELLVQAGLEDRAMHKPSALSVGQQQRLAFARMLASEPSIILADEPTGSLDSARSREMMSSLLALNRAGKTLLLVTHDLDIARQAKRTLVLSSQGQLVPETAP